MAHNILVLSKDYKSQTIFSSLVSVLFISKLKYPAIYSIVLFAFENHREALPNVSVVI